MIAIYNNVFYYLVFKLFFLILLFYTQIHHQFIKNVKKGHN